MELKNIFGVNKNEIHWKYTISLFLALMFPTCITFLLTFSEKDFHFKILNDLQYNLFLILFAILVYRFTKIKSNIIKIIIISIICGGFSQFILNLTYSDYSYSIYIASILSSILKTFLLILCWSLLIKFTKKRKLSLVFGYFITLIISLLYYIYYYKTQNINIWVHSEKPFFVIANEMKQSQYVDLQQSKIPSLYSEWRFWGFRSGLISLNL